MAITKDNPITGYRLVLMPPTAQQPEPFGWIELLNGSAAAGFIYLNDPVRDPHLNSTGTYIVTGMPMTTLDTLLSILKSGRALRIRFFDPQSPGVSPSVFIEDAEGPAPQALLALPDEEVARVQQFRMGGN
jgi:hypothetical protein